MGAFNSLNPLTVQECRFNSKSHLSSMKLYSIQPLGKYEFMRRTDLASVGSECPLTPERTEFFSKVNPHEAHPSFTFEVIIFFKAVDLD